MIYILQRLETMSTHILDFDSVNARSKDRLNVINDVDKENPQSVNSLLNG
jgi:hypothetical protein